MRRERARDGLGTQSGCERSSKSVKTEHCPPPLETCIPHRVPPATFGAPQPLNSLSRPRVAVSLGDRNSGESADTVCELSGRCH